MNSNINNAVCLKKTNAFKELCRPLLSQKEASYFIYTATYSDASRIYLCDKPDWFVAYHERLFNLGASNINYSHYNSSILLWSDFQNQDIFHIAKNEFDMNFPIFLINRSTAGSEIAIFGLNNEEQNHLNLKLINSLREFLYYFKDKGHFLIKEAQQDRKCLPKVRKSPLIIADQQNDYVMESLHRKTKKFYIGNSDQFLSEKEILCIQLSITGLTAKQIATHLDISRRTVESHIEKARLKLNARNKFDLLRKTIELGLIPDLFAI